MAPEQFSPLKTEANHIIDQTITNVRQIIYDIVPLNLSRFGLVGAVQEVCETYRQGHLIEIKDEYHHPVRFELERELALFRIVQELFNNTLKHANAKEIQLNLNYSPSRLVLKYMDDGVGFDAAKLQEGTQNGKSLGLKSIRSRIAFLNATYQFTSKPQQGVLLVIDVPLTATLDETHH